MFFFFTCTISLTVQSRVCGDLHPVPTSRRVLPPGDYDRRYRQAVCCAGCHYEQSNVTFCQTTLTPFVVHSGPFFENTDTIGINE